MLDTAAAELSEANAMFTCVSEAAPETAQRMGLAATRIAGAAVTSAIADTSGFWSKVLGLGVEEPVTAAVIDEILGFYRARGAPGATFQIAPAFLPPDWEDICGRHALFSGSTWYKLARGNEPLPTAATTELDITQVGAAEVAAAGRVIARNFGWDEADAVGIYAGALGSGVMDGFAAYENGEIVAFGAATYYGATAEMYGAATDVQHRGKGAQTALLAARIEAARARGCTAMYTETWVPGPGAQNPSYDNMLRTGFTVLYERPSWRWQPAAT